MNDKQLQFVSLEQAKRLKELGFDWELLRAYNRKGRLFYTETPYNHNSETDEFSDFAAPTVALALKWCRDEKKIQYTIECDPFVDDDVDSYYYGIKGVKFDGKVDKYEAIERKLLDESLTIIENKDNENKHFSTNQKINI